MKANTAMLEKQYHNGVAHEFLLQRKHDFIWEIPEKLFLLKKNYLQNKSIVEMGCGPSFLIAKIVKIQKIKIKDYLGIDISKKMISLAKENFPTGFYIVGNMENINLPESTADTILSLGALHHTENKYSTLSNWIRILKKSGYLLLREPTYEALKKGTGASPTEEGIEVQNIDKYLVKRSLKIKKNLYFCSHLFHLINRIFIKIFRNIWTKNEILWYPLMIFDIFISNTLGQFIPSLRGDACIIIAQKV
jgi:SAM-dependent methyltransferase